MADTAVASVNYDNLIDRQHKRILELEADLVRYSDKIRLLKTRATENHHAALAAAAAAHANVHDYARVHAAQVAMLAMTAHPQVPIPPAAHPHVHAAAAAAAAAHIPLLPTSPRLAPPLASPQTPNIFAAQAHAAAAARPHAPQDDDERAGKTRYWTEMEHNQFLYAAKLFGPKNYVAISQFVGTRTSKQVRTHAQKYQMKLEREAKKRRAQAAAVAAVTAPGAAAAAAAGWPPVCHGDPRMAMQGMPMPMPTPIARINKETVKSAAAMTTSKGDQSKSESGNAESASTCPTLHDASDAKKMDMLRESACSPVSNESEEDTAMDLSNEGDDTEMEDQEMSTTNPAPVPLCPGLKKNGSLGNLADYDDFMSRITSAVQDHRNESSGMFEGSSNEIDVDILDANTKTEQFEDSLLADL